MKELMLAEYSRLSEQIRKITAALKDLPEGTFYSSWSRDHSKWYQYINGRSLLIRKSEKAFAKALASATFLRVQLKEAQEQMDAAKAYLRNIGDTDSEAFLEKHEEIRMLLDISLPLSDSVREWANALYQKSTVPYKGTLYKTLKGDLVKSKAEKEIANALFLAGIPYRYEAAISFDGGRTFYYPDFTIMDPRTGKIFLWEHFGMEELNYYRNNNADKMYTYFLAGYIPGNNLICTSTSEDHLLTPAMIRKTIDYYFKENISQP